MSRIAIRPYDDADRLTALAMFDSNLPEYFGPGERQWFEASLDDLDGPAIVITVDNIAAAFGGYEIWEHYNKALLCWGMAHRTYHRAGLGRLLLFERLLRVAQCLEPATRYVMVDTTPLVSPFFQRFGFDLTSSWPSGYRSGLDMHELRYDLASTSVQTLVFQRDKALSITNKKLL